MEDVVINPAPNLEEEVSVDAAEKGPETKEVKPKKTRAKKKKVDLSFDRSKYYTTEKYDETLKVKQYNRRGQLVEIPTPTGRTLDREILTDEFIKDFGGGSRDNKSALHRAKCVIRTCEQFEVDPNHIRKAYVELNGKKIDGILVNDLIDRFGWADGEQRSRAMIAKQYNKHSVSVVDVAQNKLCDILKNENPSKAYVDLIKDIKEEFSRDLRDKTVYGE